MVKIIKCSNIFCDCESDPKSGYILLQDDKIKHIIDSKSFCPEDFPGIEILDFEDSYIIPGLIDINVHLNSNYDEDWNDIENVTKMAIQGGITTIIDNPLMNNYNEKFDEFEALQQRTEKITGNLYADCGLLSLLSCHNYQKIEALWNSKCILGFKMYLSLNLQHDLPQIDLKRHVKKITEHLQKATSPNIFLSIHPELASNRDLFMCSPLRGFKKEKRLDIEEEIKDLGSSKIIIFSIKSKFFISLDKFGGGIHGEMDDGDDSNKESENEEEEEKEDSEEELTTFEKDVRNLDDKVTCGTLKLKSKAVAEIQDQRAIHLLEMMGYSLNEEENEDIKEIENSDSDLNKSNSSSEEGTDEEKKYIQELSFQKKSIFSKRAPHKESGEISKQPAFEINKMFKEKLRTAINNPIFQEKIDKSLIEKDITLANTNADGNPNPNSNLNPNENSNTTKFLITNENKTNLIRSLLPHNTEKNDTTDLKKESETKQRRPSSLLMRRSSSRNPSTKSVDLALSPSTKMKEDLNKLKLAAQNCSYKIFLLNHYVSWEINGTKQIINYFSKATNFKVLISNISSPSAAFLVRNEKKKNPNLQIYCETSVPYIYFHSLMIKKGECKYKGSPPIRDQENRNLLIVALNVHNLFDCVSSFHLQTALAYKTIENGNFKRCFNGFSILGFNLQVIWTKLYAPAKKKIEKNMNESLRKEKINTYMKNIIRLMCSKPADLLNLGDRKGKIKEGYDADFVIWNPFVIQKITDDMIHLKYKKIFLLRRHKVYGKVLQTYLRGKCVFSENSEKKKCFEKFGQILTRNI